MHKNYSLYYTLNTELPTKPPSLEKKKLLKNSLSSLTKQQSEAVFLLIVEHHLVQTKTNIDVPNFIIPYEGKTQPDGVCFDINNFPPELTWILLKFLKILAGGECNDTAAGDDTAPKKKEK